MGPTSAASPLPDPETIRRTAEQVLRRPDYLLDPQPDSGSTLLEWLLRTLHWIATPFFWLLDALSGLPGWLRWPIALGLLALLILLVFHIGYTIVSAVSGPRQRRRPGRVRSEYVSRSRRARTPGGRVGLSRRLHHRDPAVVRGVPVAAGTGGEARLSPARLTASTCAATRIRRSSSPSSDSSRSSKRVGTARASAGPRNLEACRAAHARNRDFTQESLHAHRA